MPIRRRRDSSRPSSVLDVVHPRVLSFSNDRTIDRVASRRVHVVKPNLSAPTTTTRFVLPSCVPSFARQRHARLALARDVRFHGSELFPDESVCVCV